MKTHRIAKSVKFRDRDQYHDNTIGQLLSLFQIGEPYSKQQQEA